MNTPEATDSADALKNFTLATGLVHSPAPQFQGGRYDSGARELVLRLGNVSARDAALINQLVGLFCDPARAGELAQFKASEGAISLEGGQLQVISVEQFALAVVRRN